MSSTYTDLGIELMETGQDSGVWGAKTNTNLTLVNQAIDGYEAVSIAGGAQTTTLVMTNATLSNARNAVIEFTGTITGNQVVTVPNSIEKTYIIKNNTTGAFTVQFKTVSGTGPTFSTTDKSTKIVYSNGTDVVEASSTTLGNINTGTIASGEITATGNIIPGANDTYDLGTSTAVWQNLYTGDSHLSNQAKNQENNVDRTKGNWPLQ